mgnify:CR=1 FL=1
MPTIARVDLAIDDHTLSTTAGTSAGVSSPLSQGVEYLVLASGNAQNGNVNEVTESSLLVGGTIFSRSSSSCTYAPSGSLGGLQNGATAQIGAAFSYTAGASDQLEFQASSDSAGQGAQFRAVALDMSGFAASDWQHAEGPNSDTISDQPLATDGWVALDASGGALTFTPPATGDWLIFASAEAVPQTGVVGQNEVTIRTTVDGVTVSGTETGGDVNGVPLQEVYGYFTHDIVSLAGGASHTIQVEANGASGGGNIGFRRVRVHAIRVGAFVSGAVQQVTDAGEVLSGTASSDVLPLTLSMTASADYLVFARGQKSVTYWSDANILLNGALALSDGFGIAGDDLGIGAGDDLLYEQGLMIAPGLVDGDTLGVRISKVGGGGSNNYGSDIVRAGGGDASLIALRLELDGTPPHPLTGTSSDTSSDSATLSALRAIAATSVGNADGDSGLLSVGGVLQHAISAFAATSQPDFGRLIMDPLLSNVISGPIEAHYPGTSESLPWYCNAADSAVTLVERIKRPAVTNGTTVVLPEGAPDMNSVSSVSVEYWDPESPGSWEVIEGMGDVVITPETDATGQPFWDLRFLPDPDALVLLAGRGRLRRRWVLQITGGTSLRIPQKGHGFMVVNEDPPVEEPPV